MDNIRQLSQSPQGNSPLFPPVLEGNPEGRMLDVALAYAEAGISVFPCFEKDEVLPDKKTGKPVLHKTKSPRTPSGFKDATTDTKRLAAWWKDWPRAMVGMPTAGLVVVDLDVPKAKRSATGELLPAPADAPNGLRTFEALLREKNGGMPLEGVPTVKTASGGLHLFFRKGEGPRHDKIKLAVSVPTGLEGPGQRSGIDVRTGGGYVVAPGSRTAEGAQYEILENPAGGAPELPEWLLAIVAGEVGGTASLLSAGASAPSSPSAPAASPAVATQRPEYAGTGFALPEATVDEARACTPYGVAALKAACDAIRGLREGERHDRTLRLAVPLFNLVAGGELSVDYVEKALFKACRSMAVPETDREIFSALRDARKLGIQHARSAPGSWNGEAVNVLEAEIPAVAVVSDKVQPWEEIFPFSLPRPEPLPAGILPSLPPAIREFVPELSRHVGVPVELALFSVLAFRSISIQAIAEVCYGPKTSTVNLFCVPILETGERKSSALKVIISDFFETFERDLTEKAKDLRRKAKGRNASLEAKISALSRSIGKDTTRAERLQLDRKKAELEAQKIDIPAFPRFYAQDATVEELASLTASNCGRMAVVEAEGTFLEIMEGRYSNGIPRYEFLLKAYSGEPYKYDRKTGESLDFSPIVSLFLSVQSDVLRSRRHKAEARGRGLDARCFFFYPPTMKGQRGGLEEAPHVYAHGKNFYQLIREAFWLDPVQYRLTSLEAFLRAEEAEAKTAVHSAPATGELAGVDLSEVEPMGWKWEAPDPEIVRFSAPAFAVLRDYHAREEWELRPGGENSDIAGWACRKTESVARLACILHSLRPVAPAPDGSKSDFRKLPIGVEDTKTAIALVDWLGQQYRFVAREFLGADLEEEPSEDVTRALQVLEKVKTATKGMAVPAVQWRNLFQLCRRTTSKKEFEDAVNSLTLRHFLQQVRPAQEGDARKGRKAMPILYLNPEARRIDPLLKEE